MKFPYLRHTKETTDGRCLVEMEMVSFRHFISSLYISILFQGLTDCADPEQLTISQAENTTDNYYKTNMKGSNSSGALASRFKNLRKKKLYRGISSGAFGSKKLGNYTIFDSPGSDRFHFGDGLNDQNSSKHGSVVSLEWDSQGMN